MFKAKDHGETTNNFKHVVHSSCLLSITGCLSTEEEKKKMIFEKNEELKMTKAGETSQVSHVESCIPSSDKLLNIKMLIKAQLGIKSPSTKEITPEVTLKQRNHLQI